MKHKSIESLQKVLTGLLTGANQHFIHATINKNRGFAKVAKRMVEEHSEELLYAGKMINRILELGGIPELQAQKLEIYKEIESQLRVECREQVNALDELQILYNTVENDVSTQNLLIDYIKSETEHGSWLQQQVNLIDLVGIQNYLAAQL